MKETKFSSMQRILPVSTVMSVLGVFFTLTMAIYVIIFQLSPFKNIAVVVLFIFIFVILWIVLIRFAYVSYRNKLNLQNQERTQKCYSCAKDKLLDGFHYHGLITLKELEDLEGNLSLEENKEKCRVLVYTSDLATEKEAEPSVRRNRDANIQYIVLYFRNTCTTTEFKRLESLYGWENLIDLSKWEDYKENFDCRLAQTLGFDIMIFQNGKEEKKGYFAVDFSTEVACPYLDCEERCNFGLKNAGSASEPFYKEISTERVNTLYNEIMKIYRKYKVKLGTP